MSQQPQQQPLPPSTPAYCPLPDPSKRPDESLLRHDGQVIPVGHFAGRSYLSVADLSKAEIDRLMRVADYMSQVVAGPGSCTLAAGCLMAVVFFEPSTRTSTSFQAAMHRLGGSVVHIGDVSASSVAKGESLEDTMRCLQCYANLVVMRHYETGAAARAARVLQIPLINAGDGVGEHPTQALLDLYTLHGEFGRVEGLVVTMVGDLKNGRTVHSLARMLLHYAGVRFHFVSPPSLAMPDYVLQHLRDKGVQFTQTHHLDEVMKDTDVLYVTRVQKERFASLAEYESVKDEFIITPELLSRLGAKSSLRILHPLPRVSELSPELDDDPRAAYFRQMKHGLHVRMALIAALLGRV